MTINNGWYNWNGIYHHKKDVFLVNDGDIFVPYLSERSHSNWMNPWVCNRQKTQKTHDRTSKSSGFSGVLMFAGWWFGTCGWFFHILGIIIPTGKLIFFRGVGWNHQPVWILGTSMNICLVVWNMNGLFVHSVGNGIIIPTDFHSIIVQRGRYTNHQPDMVYWCLLAIYL